MGAQNSLVRAWVVGFACVFKNMMGGWGWVERVSLGATFTQLEDIKITTIDILNSIELPIKYAGVGFSTLNSCKYLVLF